MWIFSKHGFFSAVRHNERKDMILLRARVKGDLERLLDHHYAVMQSNGYLTPPNGKSVKDAIPDIETTPDADYRFRCEIPHDLFCVLLMQEASEITYGNFKEAAHDGTPRDDAYCEVWSVMSDLQDRMKMREGRKA